MYLCEVCGETYKSRGGLSYHQKAVHDGVRYPCASCPEVFSRRDYRDQHDRKQHKGLGYPCPTCARVFVVKQSLHLHQKTAHKEEPCTNSLLREMKDNPQNIEDTALGSS